MNVLKIYYPIGENKKEIEIFRKSFVKEYKLQCKIIFNNKLYPLQSYFEINNMKRKRLTIKLLYFNRIPNHLFHILSKYEECECYSESYYKKNLKNAINKNAENLKRYFYKLPKMIYKNEPLKNSIIYEEALNKILRNRGKYTKEDIEKELELVPDEKVIKIFGNNFVENNKDKCIIIYKNRAFSLREYFSTKDIDKNDEKLEIFLLELKTIKNCSYMFDRCELLEEFQLFQSHEKNDENISQVKSELIPEDENKYKDFYFNINEFNMSNNYSSISFSQDQKSLFIIYKIIIGLLNEFPSFITEMNWMFNGCSSLISLPDISVWNTENIKDISHMFSGCSSLTSLPDISKWNTKNIKNMNYYLVEVHHWNQYQIYLYGILKI